MRGIAGLGDDVMRETRSNTIAGSIKNAYMNSIPGLREQLPAKTTSYGNTIPSGGIGELVDPFISRPDRSNDPSIAPLRAEQKPLPDVDSSIKRLPGETDIDLEDRQRLLGLLRQNAVLRITNSARYKRAKGLAEGSEKRKNILEDAMRQASQKMRSDLGENFAALSPQKRRQRIDRALSNAARLLRTAPR